VGYKVLLKVFKEILLLRRRLVEVVTVDVRPLEHTTVLKRKVSVTKLRRQRIQRDWLYVKELLRCLFQELGVLGSNLRKKFKTNTDYAELIKEKRRKRPNEE
jgi:hypothetical protein